MMGPFSHTDSPSAVALTTTKPVETVAAPIKSPVIEMSEYSFVQMPDGKIVPVRNADITRVNISDVQDAPAKLVETRVEEQFYVHLSNGDVKRVNESDLPPCGGASAPHGHWQTGSNVYLVIGVYPVENVVKGE